MTTDVDGEAFLFGDLDVAIKTLITIESEVGISSAEKSLSRMGEVLDGTDCLTKLVRNNVLIAHPDVSNAATISETVTGCLIRADLVRTGRPALRGSRRPARAGRSHSARRRRPERRMRTVEDVRSPALAEYVGVALRNRRGHRPCQRRCVPQRR